AAEVLRLLEKAGENVVVNLIGLPLSDRPPFFLSLLPRIQEMRGRTGRPHWLVLDEAHHLLPAAWEPGWRALPQGLQRMLFITVHPDQVAAGALATVDTVIAVGHQPDESLRRFCKAVHARPPKMAPAKLDSGEV